MEATARSLRARKSPETPPERKRETTPRAKSIAVLSWILAFQRVPNQLNRRTQAGKPSEDANREKTNGDQGLRPFENMCWPQMQKPRGQRCRGRGPRHAPPTQACAKKWRADARRSRPDCGNRSRDRSYWPVGSLANVLARPQAR